ncbi:hypothetical protein M433DRAFT_78907, partial [Acidomyces richmondensis BFW]
RTAIYITKEIATTSWEAIYHSGDLATLKLKTEDLIIHIHNCYNPYRLYTDQGLGTIPLIQKAIQESEGRLHLLTEPGAITWETSRSCQTLDLTFSTELLRESVTHCRIREDLKIGSDYKPIQTTF